MLFAYALWHPMSHTLKFCQVKDFMKIILVSFISITFKGLRTNSASRKWLFLGSSWVLTPSNTVQFWWNFHQRHFNRNKQFLIFRETGHPKFAFLVQVWSSPPPSRNPCYPQKMTKIKESKKIKGLTDPIMEPLIVVCRICKKFGPTTFKFCGHWSQRTFQKKFKVDFEVLLLFSVPRQLFIEKKKVIFHNAEFNVELNGTNFKSEKRKTRKLLCHFIITF